MRSRGINWHFLITIKTVSIVLHRDSNRAGFTPKAGRNRIGELEERFDDEIRTEGVPQADRVARDGID
jgi:hypothetical protein